LINTFQDHTKEIKENYYDYMRKHETHTYFFDWFEEHFLQSKEIYVLGHIYRWKLDYGQTIGSNHLSLRKVNFQHRDGNVIVTPFKITTESNEPSSI